jgi:hypothetical protein
MRVNNKNKLEIESQQGQTHSKCSGSAQLKLEVWVQCARHLSRAPVGPEMPLSVPQVKVAG